MSKIVKPVAELLEESGIDDVIIFENFSYDSAFIGITDDHRAVYSYSRMIEWLMEEEDFLEEEAVEWIEYNTLGSLPCVGDAGPIIVYDVM